MPPTVHPPLTDQLIEMLPPGSYLIESNACITVHIRCAFCAEVDPAHVGVIKCHNGKDLPPTAVGAMASLLLNNFNQDHKPRCRRHHK